MKFALVGVGGAGGRIVDRLRREEKAAGGSFSNGSLLAFDTTRAAFEQYDQIPLDRHVLVGDTHPEIRGEGVDGDVELAVSVAREDRDELHREFDKLELHELDAVVVVAGLGGGTGGGVGGVIVESLQTLTDAPVYGLVVLPDESEPERTALNAARSLQSFVRFTDGVVVFDNDSWHDDAQGTLAERYDELNGHLTKRVLAVLALGELADAEIAENTLDSSDLMKTLGTGGVSVIGHAEITLESGGGLLSRLLSPFRNGTEDEPTETLAMRTQDLIKRAATRRLTVSCSIDSADRAFLVLSGPPAECSRKGFESGRFWLEAQTDAAEVFAGDDPRPNASVVSASILFANVTDVPRIEALKQRAVAAQREDR